MIRFGKIIIYFVIFTGWVISYSQIRNNIVSDIQIYPHEQKISLRYLLDNISTYTETYFIYDDDIIEGKFVSCDFMNENLEIYLDAILSPLHIGFKKVTENTFVLYKSDQRTIYGYVYDSAQKTPLVKANVYIEGTHSGMETGSNGDFLMVIPANTEILTVSYMGYETRTIHMTENQGCLSIPMNSIVIKMQPILSSARATSYLDLRIKNGYMQNERSIRFGFIPNLSILSNSYLPEIRKVTEIISNPNNDAVMINDYNNIEFSRLRTAWQENISNRARKGQLREDLTIIDGICFYGPYHLNSLPKTNSHIYSLEMTNSAEYIDGGFGADYGGAINSLLDINYGNNQERLLSGRTSVGFSGQDIFLSSADKKKYSVMLHAKRHDNKYLPNPIQTEGDITSKSHDVQTKVKYYLNPDNEIALFLLLSKDYFNYSSVKSSFDNPENNSIQEQDITALKNIQERNINNSIYDTKIISAQSEHNISGKKLTTRLSFYENHWHDISNSQYNLSTTFPAEPRYVSQFNIDQRLSQNLKEKVLEGDIMIRKDFPENRKSQLGLNIMSIQFQKDQLWQSPIVWKTNIPQQNNYGSFEQQHPMQTIDDYAEDHSGYKNNAVKLSMYYLEKTPLLKNLYLHMGYRLSLFTISREFSIDPRIRLSYTISDDILLHFAWGRYSQIPSTQQVEWLRYLNKKIKNQIAYHYIVTLDNKISENGYIKIEAFYKDLRRLVPLNRLGDGSLVYMSKEGNRNGYSVGFNIAAIYKYYPFMLEWTCTLQDSKERKSSNDNNYFPRYNYQQNTFALDASVLLWRSSRLKLSYDYGSGYAFVPYVFQDETNQWEMLADQIGFFPSYHRLDLEIERTFFLPYGSFSVSLKMINILNRKNIFAYNYTFDVNGNPVRTSKILYGFIPMVSCSYNF